MSYRNAFDVVQKVNADYPGLIASNGKQFRDQVAHRLNTQDGTPRDQWRWGIKARNPDGTNENVDALAYRNDLSDRSKKILVDIIVASETPGASPSWQEYLGDNLGNGYWTEPKLPDLDGHEPPPPPPPTGDYATKEDVRSAVALLNGSLTEQRSIVADLNNRLNAALARLDLAESELARPLTVEGNTARNGGFLSHYHGSTGLTVTRG